MKKIKARIVEKQIDGEKVKLLRIGYKADLKVVEETDEKWIIEGYASVFGNVDSYFEVVDKGAFKDFLASNFPRYPKLVWGHDWMQPLGPTLEAREDEIGLYVKGELLKDVARAREAYALIKSGAMTDLSFGFRVREDEMDQENGVRHLKKIDIFEWSPVLVGANPKATITGVKSVEGEPIDEIPAEAIVDQQPEEVEQGDTPAAGDAPAPETGTDPAPTAAADDAGAGAAEAAAGGDTPAVAGTDEGKAGRVVSENEKIAIDDMILSLREFLSSLEAYKKAADETEHGSSDTGVEQRGREDGSAKAVKLLIRDARQADKAIGKILFRAKQSL